MPKKEHLTAWGAICHGVGPLSAPKLSQAFQMQLNIDEATRNQPISQHSTGNQSQEVRRVMVPPSGLSIRNLHLLMTLLVSTTSDPSSRSWSRLWYFPLQGTCSLVHGQAGVGQRPKTVRTGVGRTP